MKNNILQNSKPAKFFVNKITWVSASLDTNHPVRFTMLSVRKVSLQEEKFNVSSRQIGVKWFHFKIRLELAIRLFTMCRLLKSWFVSPTTSRLALSPAVGNINWLVFCCLQHLFLFFFKRSWRYNFPPNKRVQQHSLAYLTVPFALVLLWCYVRMVGRKFLASMHNSKSL